MAIAVRLHRKDTAIVTPLKSGAAQEGKMSWRDVVTLWVGNESMFNFISFSSGKKSLTAVLCYPKVKQSFLT